MGGAAVAQRLSNQGLEHAYISHRKLLVDIASNLLGCRARAEDVVQEAFLKLWESGDAHLIQTPVKYIFRVVRNLAIDRLRRLALESRYHIDDEQAGEYVVSTLSPEQITLGELEWAAMLRALEDLSPRARTAFAMSQLEGYSQREVAVHLGASPTLVHFLVRDALSHCRCRLDLSA